VERVRQSGAGEAERVERVSVSGAGEAERVERVSVSGAGDCMRLSGSAALAAAQDGSTRTEPVRLIDARRVLVYNGLVQRVAHIYRTRACATNGW
jgi:hypothetical protein